MPAKAPCDHVVWNCFWVLLSQAFATWRGGGMLFSVFALAVDRFVTIGRRTAQFCFGLLMRCLFLGSPLRPTRLLTRQLCGPGCVCRPEFSIIRLKNKQCSTLVDNALSLNSPHVTVCVQCAHTCCTRPCPRLLCPFTRCVSVRCLVLFTCGWGSCAAWSLDFNLRTRFVVAFLVLFVCWFKLV